MLEAVLGQGGMGTVYRARQTTLGNRTVALKVLPRGLADRDPRSVERFRREASLAAAIHHPNLAEVYGFEAAGDTLCFAMRLVEGPTLHDVLVQFARRHDGPVRSTSTEYVRRCVLLGRALADALAEIHARGLVHRDVKPSNVLLEHGGGDPEAALLARPVLVDFGLLRPAGDATLTGTRTLLGTPAYASHDSLLGRDLDPRADVFSLAATLHDLLTSTSPETRAPATAGLPDVRAINPVVDRRLGAVLAMALQDRKELRYEHGGALRDELDRWLRGESLRAAPTRALGRLRLWARRNPARAARSAALALVPALLLAALGIWSIAVSVDRATTVRAAAAHEADGDLLAAAQGYRGLFPPDTTTRLLWWLRPDVARARHYWAPDGPLQPAVRHLLTAEEALDRGDIGAPDALLAQQRTAFRLIEVLLDERHRAVTDAIERYFVREADSLMPVSRRVVAIDALADYLVVQDPPQRVPAGLLELLRATLSGPQADSLPGDLRTAAIAALGAIRSVEAFLCMVEVLHQDLTDEQSRIARAGSWHAYRWLQCDERSGSPPTIGRNLHERLGAAQLESWAAGYERQALRCDLQSTQTLAMHLAFWEDDPEDGPDPGQRRLALPSRLRAEVDTAHEWLSTEWREGREQILAATSGDTDHRYHVYLHSSGRFAPAFESAVWRPTPGEDRDQVLATAAADPGVEHGAVHFANGGRVTLSGTVSSAACRAGVLTDSENKDRAGFLKLTRPGHSLLRIRSRVPPNAKNLRVLVTQMIGTRDMLRSRGTVGFRLQLAGRPWRLESIVADHQRHGRTRDREGTHGGWPDWPAGVTTAYDIPLQALGDVTEIELVLEYLYGNTTWRLHGVELLWNPPDPSPAPPQPK
ncbi:MAG: serine/threonine protein kinase [Planctomycetes bacterium]|nr:serine/threonine protein kinase [Planctomycetota bacterium]